MKLDHATIVTMNLAQARHFFAEVVGLREGARPPFRVAGHWFYDGDQPVIHLIDATLPAPVGLRAPRIDHIAFRVPDARAWSGLIRRLQDQGMHYEVVPVPVTEELQLFVAPAPGITIEFVMRMARDDMASGVETTAMDQCR